MGLILRWWLLTWLWPCIVVRSSAPQKARQ